MVSHRPLPASSRAPRLASATIPKWASWLDAEARAFWKRHAPEKVRQRILTVSDLEAFAHYAQTYSDMVRLQAYIAANGETFTTPTGYVAQRPEVARLRTAMDFYLKFAARFGDTPADRTRVQATPVLDDDDVDPWERF